jgi:hypothetical protein
MNDSPQKRHTGYLVEGLELFIRKVAYTKYDATVLVQGMVLQLGDYKHVKHCYKIQRNRMLMGWVRLDRLKPLVNSCEYCNGPLDSMNSGNFLTS